MLPSGVRCVARDLSEDEKQVVWATHAAPAAPVHAEGRRVAWRSKPSRYILAKKDRQLQRDLKRFLASSMGARTYEVESSHVPMFCTPSFVFGVIRTAASAVADSTGG